MTLPLLLAAALLYPEAILTHPNLFSDDAWRSRCDTIGATEHRWEKQTGGPFRNDEPAWFAASGVAESCFWQQNVPLAKGHRYLVGMWVRRDRARALIWCRAQQANGHPLDKRLYLFGGFNDCLTPYLRDRMKAKLGGNPNEWKLMYRPLDITQELTGPMVFKLGIYMSTGSVTFAHPFLLDITGETTLPLTVELTGARAAKRLALAHVGIRDVIWSKNFTTQTATFRETIPTVSDALRGFTTADQGGNGRVDGHSLTVSYADGTNETVFAPQENVFMYR